MKLALKEKRREIRCSAARPVVLKDRDGQEVARGRTANTSLSGLFAIVDSADALSVGDELVVEISVPRAPTHGSLKGPPMRNARFHCRVVRLQRLGHLSGVGIELVEPVDDGHQ